MKLKRRPEIEECQGVYPPREDSYLLVESIETGDGERFLDVGTGTGIVGIYAALSGAEVTAIDINPRAVDCARRNASSNGVRMVVETLDISDCRGTYEVMAFNPPYLPESGSELGELGSALESGSGGTDAAKAFLTSVDRCLSPGGRAYLVLSSHTDISFLEDMHSAFIFTELARKHIFFEDILVFLVKRRKDL